VRPNLATLVEDFRAHATETAVVSHLGVRRYATTYADLAQLAGRFASELDCRHIAPGDRVILWGDNSANWIAAFFGCLLRGVLVVPLDAAGSPTFAQRILLETTPSLIVADPTLLHFIQTEIPPLPLPSLAATLPSTPNFLIDPSVQPDAPFQIIFTSGTTAEPKGIVHTHRNVLASLSPIESEIAKYRRYERWVHPLRFLHTLPLSHVFGQFMGLWIPAILSAELHFAERPESARILDLTRRERISVLIAVPRVLALLRTHLLSRFPSLASSLDKAASLSALKRWWHFRSIHRAFGLKFWAVISGGASLAPDLERFWNQLGFALIQGYGMTETAALVTLNHPFRIGQGTIGKALPGREVRLSDTGELLVRGEMVSTSTWQHGRLQPRNDDWLATGDLAEQSPSGDFRFLGRKGEAIVTSAGLNIYPADIESAVLQQPGVRACAVVPCDLTRGIEPVTVVLFSGDDTALQQAIRTANQTLADFQQIRRHLRWPGIDFPYTSTGKLLRRNLRDWACAALQNQTSPQSAQDDALVNLVAEIAGVPAAPGNDDRRLSEDLYLDSLGRVQLASAIEQHMGVELNEDQIAAITTLGDLRAAITPHRPTPYATNTTPHSAPAETKPRTDPHIYPRWPWSWPIQALRTAFLELAVRPLVAIFLGPVVARPQQLLPPGPMLLIANHVTMLDGPLILYALPPHARRHVTVAMSGEMLLNYRHARGQDNALQNLFAPVAYWLLTALFNVFPLPRLRGFKRSFAHAGDALDRNYSVLIFPEGTRSHGKAMASFRPGIGVLAADSRVPVLPIAIVGFDKLLQTKRLFPRRHLVQIRIGKPITLPPNSTPTDWTARLEHELRSLLA
jgi:long-chain acyl-CoA synthetase